MIDRAQHSAGLCGVSHRLQRKKRCTFRRLARFDQLVPMIFVGSLEFFCNSCPVWLKADVLRRPHGPFGDAADRDSRLPFRHILMLYEPFAHEKRLLIVNAAAASRRWASHSSDPP